MDVQTDHRIVAFGGDRMMLFNADEGVVIVDCNRANGVWTVSAEGVPDVTADNRPDAITAMVDQALNSLGGTGYSCTVPHGLAELP